MNEWLKEGIKKAVVIKSQRLLNETLIVYFKPISAMIP